MVKSAPALFGRTSEFASLCRQVDVAAGGTGRATVIEGEAGIGKTFLLGALLDYAEGRGFEIFRGAADELEQHRPFGAILDAFEIERATTGDRRQAVADLLRKDVAPSESATTPFDSARLEFRVIEALLAALEELSSRRPVVIAIDDLQWADPSTLVVLHRMAKLIETLPVVIVCTARPLPRRRELEQLLRSMEGQGAAFFTLGPLDQQAVDELLESMLGAPPGPRLLHLVSGASGNPLFISELVESLERDGLIERTPDGKLDAPREELPPSLRITILHRMSSLNDDSLRALRVASVLGTRFSLADLAVVLARPPTSLLAIVDEWLREGFVGEEGDDLAFRHELIREALYEDMPAPVLRGLHLEIAHSLVRAGTPRERVAEHIMRGASPGDLQAIEWLHEAAAEAAPRAPAVSVEILEQALGICGERCTKRDALLADLVRNLTWAGRRHDAEALCREALSRPLDPDTEEIFQLSLIQCHLASGRAHEALAQVERALSSPSLSESNRGRLLAWASQAHMLVGDLDGATRVGTEGVVSGEQSNDPFTISVSLAGLSAATNLRGDFHEAVALTSRAIEVADSSPGREAHRFQLHVFHGGFLMELDRIDDGLRTLERGLELSEEIGATWSLPFHYHLMMLGRFWSGDWDGALTDYDTGMALAEELGTAHAIMATSIKGLIALHRGDVDEAGNAVKSAERQFAETGPQYRATWVMWARALLLDAIGDVTGAFAVLLNAWELCTGAQLRLDYPVLGPDLIRLALAAGDRKVAEDVVGRVEEVARMNPEVGTVAGAALRCRGLVDDDASTLARAVESYRQGPRRFDLALACEDAAVATARAGGEQAARGFFDDALEIYGRLRADRPEARLRARQRDAGIRAGARGGRRRPKTGWASLTETERRVAELLAQGLSTPDIAERLFVSRRTVQTHISHILAKLGLESRVALAAAAARR